jgi:NADH dehydrogenase FAD-containing subunit
MTEAHASGERHHVVVVGAGFGGLAAVRALGRADVDVTLINRDNYHGFWPLLYQVATAGLGPDDIASPVRSIVEGQANARVRLGTVTGIDLDRRTVSLRGGPRGGEDGREEASRDGGAAGGGANRTTSASRGSETTPSHSRPSPTPCVCGTTY